MMRTLMCIKSTDLSMGYLETMNVVVNMGTHWSIMGDNDGEKLDQPKQQPHERGRRNVRSAVRQVNQCNEMHRWEVDIFVIRRWLGILTR